MGSYESLGNVRMFAQRNTRKCVAHQDPSTLPETCYSKSVVLSGLWDIEDDGGTTSQAFSFTFHSVASFGHARRNIVRRRAITQRLGGTNWRLGQGSVSLVFEILNETESSTHKFKILEVSSC